MSTKVFTYLLLIAAYKNDSHDSAHHAQPRHEFLRLPNIRVLCPRQRWSASLGDQFGDAQLFDCRRANSPAVYWVTLDSAFEKVKNTETSDHRELYSRQVVYGLALAAWQRRHKPNHRMKYEDGLFRNCRL